MSQVETITISDDDEDGEIRKKEPKVEKGDDDIVLLEEESSHRQTNVFTLAVRDKVKRERLSTAIRALGGVCLRQSNCDYSSSATHCIFYADGRKDMYIHNVLGCLASGRPVLTEAYVKESVLSNRFLDVCDRFLHPRTRNVKCLVDFKGNRLFRGWTAAVMVDSRRIKQELEAVLVDGGAVVQHLTPQQLTSIDARKFNDSNFYIFTEPTFLDDYYFKKFMNSKKRGGWQVQVYSFFYVWKFISDPSPKGQEFLAYFEIENAKLMDTLHVPKIKCEKDTVRKRGIALAAASAELDMKMDEKRRGLAAGGSVWPAPKKKRREVLINVDLTGDDEVVVKEENNMKKKPQPERKRIERKIAAEVVKKTPLYVIEILSSDDDEDQHNYVEILEGSDDEKDDDDKQRHRSDSELKPKPKDKEEKTEEPEVKAVDVPATQIGDASYRNNLERTKELAGNIQQEPVARENETPSLASKESEVSPHPVEYEISSVSPPLPPSAKVLEATSTSSFVDQPFKPETRKPAITDGESSEFSSQETDMESHVCQESQDPFHETDEEKASQETQPDVLTSQEKEEEKRTLYIADVNDVSLLKRVLYTLIERRKDKDECIDIANAKIRTLHFDRDQFRQDRRKRQEQMAKESSTSGRHKARREKKNIIQARKVMDDHDNMAFEVWQPEANEVIDPTSRKRDQINSLEDLGGMVNSRSFPQAETMHTILNVYIVDGDAEVAHFARQFIDRVISLHPPSSTRHYYLSFMRSHFDGELSQSFSGSDDLWDLFKWLLATKCVLGLQVIANIMQADLEYFWKHMPRRACADERPIILHLYSCKDSNIETRARIIGETLLSDNVGRSLRETLLRILSMTGLLCACLDVDSRLTDLTRQDSLKAKLARNVSLAFKAQMESKTTVAILSLLRPSWLSLLVVDNLLVDEGFSGFKANKLNMLLDLMLLQEGASIQASNLLSTALPKMLDTLPYHIVQRTMSEVQLNVNSSQKKRAKNPFASMDKLAKESIQRETFRLDTRISIERDAFQAGVEIVNDEVSRLERDLASMALTGSSKLAAVTFANV